MKIRPLVLAAALLPLSPVASFAQGANVGLYTDASGTTCSFTGNNPGTITAYVVFRPDVGGVNTVQFSAPVPACLGAVFVGETVAPGMTKIGNSQTGVSILLQSCYGQPVSVLQISYMRAASTQPCCAYPILPDPTLSEIAASDCAFQEVDVTSVVAHFNADASCECEGNSPPTPPTNPNPPDNTSGHGVRTQMSWFAQDVDGNITGYDLYLGTSSNPPLVASNLPMPAYLPNPPLAELTKYYWRVVVRDARGLEGMGPVWSFTTRVANSPPFPPTSPNPPSGAQDVALNATLLWQASDIDADSLIYDVYFGTSTSPPLVSSNQAATMYVPGPLAFDTIYYWRVVARDGGGLETSGPVWSYTTRPENYAPAAPSNPTPANNAINLPLTTTLSWTASDRDHDPLVYDVYFGTSATPPLLASNVTTASHTVDGLEYATQYRWRVVARDTAGNETSGPTWTFTSRPVNLPPNAPTNPVPSNFASNQRQNVTLTWQCTDPDQQLLTFDVYLGTAVNPPLVASNVGAPLFQPPFLAPLTTYRWKIVARDNLGATTTGPTWAFSTEAGNRPPNPPTNPSPPIGVSDQPLELTLSWSCTDPEGDALNYDVYMGEDTPSSLIASNITSPSHFIGGLKGTTVYAWRIDARDALGGKREGPTWWFRTRSNSPPNTPSNPDPSEAASIPPENAFLTWHSSDPDGHPVTFEVRLGTGPNIPTVATNLDRPEFDAGDLIPNSHYFWQILARDNHGAIAGGPMWNFWTLEGNYPPTVPSSPTPADGATNQNTNQILNWYATDPEQTRLTFDLFMGASQPPPLFVSNIAAPFYQIALAPRVTYYWRIRARDAMGAETMGPLWTFVTDSNASPMPPFAPTPPNGIIKVAPTAWLSWGSRDPENSPVTHDVYFGTTQDPPLVISNTPLKYYVPGQLAFTTTYRWRVVVHDPEGHETSGPVWSFTTRADLPPAKPYLPSPQYNGSAAPTSKLSWHTNEPDGQPLTHALYFGVTWPPPLVDSLLTGATPYFCEFDPGPLQPGMRYFWKVVSSDGGLSTAGPIWSFTVGTIVNVPEVVTELTLHQNHPNPFNPQTTISYDVPASLERERVRLSILDITGRLIATVVDDEQARGPHVARWFGQDGSGQRVASGVYFYVLQVGHERRTRKLVLLK